MSDVVDLQGTILKVSAKEPKQGKSKEPKPKQISTEFELDGTPIEALAQLCEFPEKAKEAMNAAVQASGKLELPCVAKTMQVDYYLGVRKRPSLQVDGATLRKIVLDARREPTAKLLYSEPYGTDVVSFQGDNLGMEMRLNLAKHQGELPGVDGGEG